MFRFRKTDPKKALANQKREPERYKKERELSQSDRTSDRMKLAKSENTHKEILYYLAENDPNENVRKAVANNLMTPIQASEAIAKDKSVDVRMALVKRLSFLLPDLSADEYSHLYAHVVQALSMLALDEVIKIRRALSSSLKDKAYTPPKVAATLAKDIEKEVAEPILKFCVAIPDKDLIEILKQTKHEWAAVAIAEREKISADVSKAVIDRPDLPKAGASLLKNDGAELTDDLLEYIIEHAKSVPEWHEPLATRKNLPADMLKRIANFVSRSVRNKMLNEHNFDPETKQEIEDAVKRRLNFFTNDKGKPISPEEKLRQLIADEALDEDAISDGLALKEKKFVLKALAHLSQMKLVTVSKIFSTKAPKAIVALAWKSGLTMRFAFQLQKDLAKINHKELVYPKSGNAFPLDENTMQFQLDFFTEE